MQFSSSQPDFAAGSWEAVLVASQTQDKVSFSQPIKPEHMLLGSQLLGTPGASQVISRFYRNILFSLRSSTRNTHAQKFCVICTTSHICLQTLLQRLVRRLTRFFTTVNADASLSALKSACDCLALNYKLACTKLVHLHLGKVNRDKIVHVDTEL